jgi:hypothetical protein
MEYACGRCAARFRAGLDLWRCWACERVLCRLCAMDYGVCVRSDAHEAKAKDRAAALLRGAAVLILVHEDGTRSAIRMDELLSRRNGRRKAGA